MATLASHKKRIVLALKKTGAYSPHLTVQIDNLSNALQTLDMCNRIKSSSDFEPFIEKPTREGSQLVEHPVFKVEERTRNSIDRQMRQLKLTVEDIVGSPDVPDEADRVFGEMEKIE